ncbi:MAG: NifB/NifX family molybdenum-iron cluster-binding protein [Coriobacteriia bacterium]|jgi:predicted Fe-Mo cluster-binding NifX family protein|nr:NifB/NifX family molybdenum-iron cluster-binding protein [Coriobacteriia bacterium]
MRIAVSALGTSLDAQVDERFGRAEYLLIVDPSTLEVEVVDNAANRNALQGAGIGAAETVASRGAEAVLTGHLGPKAYQALQAASLKGYAAAGMTVHEAVEAFMNEALAVLDEGEAHGGLE